MLPIDDYIEGDIFAWTSQGATRATASADRKARRRVKRPEPPQPAFRRSRFLARWLGAFDDKRRLADG